MIPLHDSELVKQGKIVMNRLSQLNDYDFTEVHRHNYFELFYFETGGGKHVIDFEDFEITSNSVQVVAPGQVHQMHRALDSKGYVLLFGLDALGSSPVIRHFLEDLTCLGVNEYPRAYQLLQQQAPLITAQLATSFAAMERQDKFHGDLLQNDLQRLCLFCLQQLEDVQSIPSTEYGQFRRLLLANFKEMKTSKQYADQMNLTPKSLNALVKKYSGKTTSELIYEQIMIEAKRLLRMQYSVKEVALDLNFDDPAHFSKFFKTYADLSPSKFREIQHMG